MLRAAFYKAPGLPYNYLVRWWDRGPYSHCELQFSDGMAASSSFMDGGVRFKAIDWNPDNWDFIDLPDHLEVDARAWFEANKGAKYDWLGNVRFLLGFLPNGKDQFFCSEAVAAALGFTDPWRFTPNSLASALERMTKPA